MKLMRRLTRPRTRADRAGERYIAGGADVARQLGHDYVGTEHVLLALTRNSQGGATRILSRLGVTHADIEDSALLAQLWAPRIDPDALATLGIDFEAVRERVEETFGPGALGQAHAASGPRIQCIAPRLKQSLEHAVDRAGEQPLLDEHVLLGMVDVPDSIAARVLAELGVSIAAAEGVMQGRVR